MDSDRFIAAEDTRVPSDDVDLVPQSGEMHRPSLEMFRNGVAEKEESHGSFIASTCRHGIPPCRTGKGRYGLQIAVTCSVEYVE
jgi:hypothetical protein